MIDVKVFVEADEDVRLSRRILRDVSDRGFSIETVLDRHHRFAKPAYNSVILKYRTMADIIVSNNSFGGSASEDAASIQLLCGALGNMIAKQDAG